MLSFPNDSRNGRSCEHDFSLVNSGPAFSYSRQQAAYYHPASGDAMEKWHWPVPLSCPNLEVATFVPSRHGRTLPFFVLLA
jgi:hypothetical protein